MELPRSACFELHTLKFIGEGANALIIGKPGTGKSQLAWYLARYFQVPGGMPLTFDVRSTAEATS